MKVCVCDKKNYWYKYKISNRAMNYMFVALFLFKERSERIPRIIVIMKLKPLVLMVIQKRKSIMSIVF